MPFPVDIDEAERLNRMVAEETMNFDVEGGLACVTMLNKEQQIAYNTIIEKVKTESSGVFSLMVRGDREEFFIQSTFSWRKISKFNIASSGVSASLLPGGRTAHLRFKIPLEIVGKVSCSISKQSALGTLLKMCKLIIWDEAPMVNHRAIEAVENMLRDVTDCDLPFGGKVIILGGDFRQVLPVVPRGKKEDIMKANLVFSDIWPLYLQLPLVKNMRAKLNPIFCDYLLRIGDRTEKEHKAYTDHLHDMMNIVILTPKNECVDYINKILLDQIPGEIFTYYSFDEAIDKSEQSLQEYFLNSLTPNGIPPHELKLKVNCRVILLRNINHSEGLCNGTRLTCRKFNRNVILAEITIGEYRRKYVFLPRIPFVTSLIAGNRAYEKDVEAFFKFVSIRDENVATPKRIPSTKVLFCRVLRIIHSEKKSINFVCGFRGLCFIIFRVTSLAAECNRVYEENILLCSLLIA
ncbi:ATP-dependent DNA helicase PIF1-like [Olea europaea var. sylvestris]|uniref:ATP-dependent DNA helicase PIF1-like n=1 Tax=Olea europaea var. sylvestris TaxID=158386 RepID=UPI000C1D0CB2|nr:ATP-dependent DNA helicase PIF1-like [Olea europaea var. sylvestris]